VKREGLQQRLVAVNEMTVTSPHGFTLEFVDVAHGSVITVFARGRLSHQDYQEFIPQLEAAIAEQTGDRLRLVFDARELVGWEPQAAVDDLRLGLRHGRHVERVALITEARWLTLLSSVVGLLMPGELRHFEDRASADAWIRA